jgi:proline iminopeptidase
LSEQSLYPEIEPYDHGLLDVGDGHRMYWANTTHHLIADTRPDQPRNPRYEDPVFRLCFARLVTHYWRHAAWLEEGALLRGVERLAGVPGVLVHGRLDVSSPLDVPWNLARSWPGSELVIVDDAGHGGGPSVSDALVSATDRFAHATRKS